MFSRRILLIGLPALTVVLTACSSPSTKPAVTTSTSHTPARSSTTGSPPTTSIPICTTSHLTISSGLSQGATGHISTVLLFANSGTTTCNITGYPGLAGLNASGTQVVQAQRTLRGFTGGLAQGATAPPVVDLTPNQTASALVEGTDVPTGNATSCPSYPAFLVTPPNETHSVQLSLASAFPGCSQIQIHPVVPGTSGSSS